MPKNAMRALLVFGPLALLLLLWIRSRNDLRRPAGLPDQPAHRSGASTPASGEAPGAADPTDAGRPGPPAPDGRPSAQITDAQGKPLRARIIAAVSRDYFKTFERVELEADDSGRLALPFDAQAWMVLSVHAPGYAGRWYGPVTFGELDLDDLEFHLKQAVSCTGRLVSLQENPFPWTKVRFSPRFPPNTFSGIVASRLEIVDEEVITDAGGRFECRSLRPGEYQVSFPDEPSWPALHLPADPFAKGEVTVRVPWEPPRK